MGARQREAARRGLRCVLAVVALDSGEARRDELREQVLKGENRAGMRERRHPAVIADQRDRFERRQTDPRDVGGRILRDDRRESLVVAPHVALFAERLREVGAPEGAALSDLEDTLERDRVAEAIQLLDHELDAPATVLPQPPQALL